MKVTIPVRTYSLTNQREHWAKKARRAKSERSWAYTLTAGIRKLGLPLTVTLTRIAPRALDDDNIRAALKSIRDGVADRIGIDDGDSRVTWCYAQRRGKPREYAVEIEAAKS
jgi:hypothetical protein